LGRILLTVKLLELIDLEFVEALLNAQNGS